MFLRAAAFLLPALVAAAPVSAQCTYVSFPLGSGCGFSSTGGIPVLSCFGAPSIGNASFGFTTTAPCLGVPVVGLLLVGLCLPAPVVFTNPASGLCLSQVVCALYVDAIVMLPGLPYAGGFAFSTPVPNDPQLVGLELCIQGAHTCSALSCVSGTNALRVTVF